MYQVGELVVYGIHGVCRIVGQEEKRVDRKNVTYLVLEPVTSAGSRFLVPSQSAAAMGKLRPVMTSEAFEELLSSPDASKDLWIKEDGRRKQAYRELIGSGDPVRLAGLVSTLYRHKARQIAAGKKVHQSDDNFLRDAERLLVVEASIVHGMDLDQAKTYIRGKLKEDA